MHVFDSKFNVQKFDRTVFKPGQNEKKPEVKEKDPFTQPDVFKPYKPFDPNGEPIKPFKPLIIPDTDNGPIIEIPDWSKAPLELPPGPSGTEWTQIPKEDHFPDWKKQPLEFPGPDGIEKEIPAKYPGPDKPFGPGQVWLFSGEG